MPARLLIDTPFHVVLRGNITADGVERERGEVVETRGWRNVQPLVNVRQLAPLAESSTPVDCGCGRRWVDEDAALAHMERGTCSKAATKTATNRTNKREVA